MELCSIVIALVRPLGIEFWLATRQLGDLEPVSPPVCVAFFICIVGTMIDIPVCPGLARFLSLVPHIIRSSALPHLRSFPVWVMNDGRLHDSIVPTLYGSYEHRRRSCEVLTQKLVLESSQEELAFLFWINTSPPKKK